MKLLSKLPDDILIQLQSHGTELSLNEGERLIPSEDCFYLVLDGEIQVEAKPLLLYHRGESLRIFPGLNLMATVASRVLSLQLNQVLQEDSAVESSLMVTLLGQPLHPLQLQEQEKLATIGRLSAGIIHELKNPAAASGRAAEQLRDRFLKSQFLTHQLYSSLEHSQIDFLVKLKDEIFAQESVILDPIIQSDREEELARWLEDYEIAESWQIAATLTEAGLEVQQLQEIQTHIPEDALLTVLQWLETSWTTQRLLQDIEQSSQRLTDLIQSVKANAYLGATSSQFINIHEGLENTLRLLHHKLKTGITVTREYASNLPLIPAYSSELNQVWTNLIDNAIDAMKGQGNLRIRTFQEKQFLVVEIIDNGEGIPPEVQSRIFEQFFTTKAVGQGTGLGLHIARNIIVEQHHGEIRLQSQPGETCFQVYLPLSQSPS